MKHKKQGENMNNTISKKTFKTTLQKHCVLISILILLSSVNIVAFTQSGLTGLQNATRNIAKTVLPTVVTIDTSSVIKVPVRNFGFSFPFRNDNNNDDQDDDAPTREFNQEGLGSGIFVKKIKNTYYILTNAHVVEGADEISIVTTEEDEFEAELVGLDKGRDLALISIVSKKKQFTLATLGNSDTLQQGDIVFAIGNPYGFRSSITFGIVSALDREASPNRQFSLTNYIQTDAAVNRGNSGGPLVNINGEVIGINTWIFSSRGGGNEGLSFAVPINNAKSAIDDFIEKGSIDYGWLGAQIGKIFEKEMASLGTDTGVLISGLYLDSPANKAGVQVGDIVLAVNGQDVTTDKDLVKKITDIAPGEDAKLRLLRQGKEKTISVTLARRNVEKDTPDIGVWPSFGVVDITATLKKRLDLSTSSGVVITNVEQKGLADVAGLKPGDVIERVNNKKVKNMQNFFKELNKVKEDEEANFRLNRDGTSLVVGIIKG